MAVLLTPPYLQFFNGSTPLDGGKLYTYAAGTTTPKATFTDESGSTEASNPVILDSLGRTTVWISGSYKFRLYDKDDNFIRETDNVKAFTATGVSSASFHNEFSGDGSQTVFTLSEDMGTDEKAIMVFIEDATAGFFQLFSGDGAETAFTLSQDMGTDENSIQVFVDSGGAEGYEPQNPSAYTLNGTTLTFGSAPATGTDNIYVFQANRQSDGVSGFISPNLYTLNGTALTFSAAPSAGTNNIQVIAPSKLVNAASAAADAADTSATNAAASAATSTTNANQTAADRVQTGLDVVATAADAVATAADRVQTGADRTQTGLDAISTAADRVQTGLDTTATAADRVQTGLDRTAAETARTGAETAETNAAASATAAEVAKIEWRGAYSGATAYALNDAVTHNGSSFICIQAGTNQTPAVGGTAYWDDLANKGDQGDQGIQGPPGNGDLSSTANLSDLANVVTARTNLGLEIGVNVQAYAAVLNDLANSSGNGIVATNSGGTNVVKRTITGTANRITVTNGNGNSGNPTIDIGDDVVTTADLAGVGGGYFTAGHANDLYYTGFGFGVGTLFNVVADRLYAIHFNVQAETAFTRIGFNSSATLSEKVRIGIYNAADGLPSTLLVDCGEVTLTVSGEQEIVINQTLSPGMYFLAFVSDGTASVSKVSYDITTTQAIYGARNIAGNMEGPNGLYKSQTYGALPASFGGGITYSYGANVPLVYLRKV